jgi:hypothetical protein
MYAGGAFEPVLEMLAADIVWHVPGASPIAGDHRGVQAVHGYFQKRRTLARSMRMHPGQTIALDDVVVQLVDGSLLSGTETLRWRTVGVYRIRERQISEVWLVPVELDLFDQIWSHGA